jgi:hypothetical protein
LSFFYFFHFFLLSYPFVLYRTYISCSPWSPTRPHLHLQFSTAARSQGRCSLAKPRIEARGRAHPCSRASIPGVELTLTAMPRSRPTIARSSPACATTCHLARARLWCTRECRPSWDDFVHQKIRDESHDIYQAYSLVGWSYISPPCP